MKTGLTGTYCWIPVSQELPDDSETVLICNLERWSEPVEIGFCEAGEWFWSRLPGMPLDGLDCAGGNDCETHPPTHWMRFPEPPGVAILPEHHAVLENPFRAATGGVWCTVEDRLHIARHFDASLCRAALALPDLQKTVRRAIELRLRKLERSAK